VWGEVVDGDERGGLLGAWLAIPRELIRKWHYPEHTRERIDPLRVFNLYAPEAPREVPGRPPPVISPGYGPTAPLLAAERAAIEANGQASP